MIKRQMQERLTKLASQFKAVSVIGPRQSGKTTLCKMTFPDKKYVLLENLQTRRFAQDDPIGFLETYPDGAIFDEIQNVPELFSYLQEYIDNTTEKGKYILTGSNNFLLHQKITQSLAGRVAILHLLPFSIREMKNIKLSDAKLMFQGFYPPIVDQKLTPSDWLENYIMTYIERDVRQLLNIQNLHLFTRFIKLLASRTGQELNLSSLGNAAGVDYKTIQSWIGILEASFIIHLLPSHHKNFSKTIIKRPKLYFYDTGLVCSLLQINNPTQLQNHPLFGNIFETMIVSELLKSKFNTGEKCNYYYWRTKTGVEVDVIKETHDKLIPIEIKSSQTIASDFFKNIKYYQNKNQGKESYLLYRGKELQKRSDGVEVMNWRKFFGA